jgi:hypothetical protein
LVWRRGSEQSGHYALNNFNGLALSELDCGSIFDYGRKHLPGTERAACAARRRGLELSLSPLASPLYRKYAQAFHHPEQGVDRKKIHGRTAGFKEHQPQSRGWNIIETNLKLSSVFKIQGREACPKLKRKKSNAQSRQPSAPQASAARMHWWTWSPPAPAFPCPTASGRSPSRRPIPAAIWPRYWPIAARA